MDVREDVRYRAMMMGIATGNMPNVDLIWAVQRSEGFKSCFGQTERCGHRECHWRKECLALDFYRNVPLPIKEYRKQVEAEKRRVVRTKLTFVERAPASAGTLEPAATASSRS